MRNALALFAVIGLLAAPAAAQNDAKKDMTGSKSIEVAAAAVGTGIKDRAIDGEAQSFPADVGRVYFHTTLEGDFTEENLEHVWYRSDAEVSRVKLTAKGPGPWRTWSYKTIPGWAGGDWKVEVVDAAGKVLKSVKFDVTGGEPASAASTTSATKAMPAAQPKMQPKSAMHKTATTSTTTSTAPAGINVTAAVVGTGVENRAAVGVAANFGADVGKVYFHTTLAGDFPEQELQHVWSLNGKEMSRVNLKAKGPAWRTWSYKTIGEGMSGNWSASLVDANGNVLKTTEFTVK